MFDKQITLTSTDGSVSVTIEAGTEGLKSLTVHTGNLESSITAQKLIDLAAPALVAWITPPDPPIPQPKTSPVPSYVPRPK